jgi:hypothetical protein
MEWLREDADDKARSRQYSVGPWPVNLKISALRG